MEGRKGRSPDVSVHAVGRSPGGGNGGHQQNSLTNIGRSAWGDMLLSFCGALWGNYANQCASGACREVVNCHPRQSLAVGSRVRALAGFLSALERSKSVLLAS